eukprot:jgi/Chlat1/6602/Chrsp46S09070
MEAAEAAALVRSAAVAEGTTVIRGYDFNSDDTHAVDYEALLRSYAATGFQATAFAQAVAEVDRMLAWRLSHEEVQEEEEEEEKDGEDDKCSTSYRESVKTKIFLGYTSNLISSGVRETIRFLTQHKMVDVIVTTAGGVEEDFVKCLGNTYLGDFHLKGAELRAKACHGLNRIGNLIVPNDNYCAFEDWVMPILDAMLEEQQKQGALWTPSRMIARLGKEINNPDSIYYWAHVHGIPVFCPGLTDGSLGDMMYFHSVRNPGLVLDIITGKAPDYNIREMNNQAVFASPRKTGVIVLGGGLPKHHICNANMMRNGADFAVFINTANEFDGSDSGARPDEAVSWGKIRATATPVKVYADATLVFPLLVAQTFAKQHHASRKAAANATSNGTA